MDKVIEKIIIDSGSIREFCREVARKIKDFYSDRDKVTVLTVLEGGARFTRALRETGMLDCKKFSFHNIRAQSYGSSSSPCAEVKVDLNGTGDVIRSSAVLLIDDIYDTGNTLSTIIGRLRETSAAQVNTCVMLERKRPHKKNVRIDFRGAYLDSDDFVVGFGLDYQNRLRDLDYIATVKKEYQK